MKNFKVILIFCYCLIYACTQIEIKGKTAHQPLTFTDKIKWNLPHESENVEIVDVCGKLVYSGSNIESVDFSFLDAGVYFARVKNSTQTLVKIIK